MDGYIFLEVDNSGKPVYGDKLKEVISCGNDNMVLILSNEYNVNYTMDLIDLDVVVLPGDLIDEIDKKIESKENRETLLAISEIDSLEKWLEFVIKEKKINILTTIEHYVSCAHVCKKEHVLQTYMYSNKTSSNNNVFGKNNVDNNNLEIQIQQQATMIQELKNEIQDKKVYIDSILTHATNLDNELKKYRNWYEQSPKYGEKVEELEKINNKCTQLYKETLDKMDVLLTENLSLKKKYKVK